MNALERRQAILELLCERRFEKMENLAFEFSVHECTIRRDIQELSLSYPLYTKTGTYGGVYVMDGFNLRTKYLNIKQKELLERLKEKLNADDKEILESILTGFTRPMKK